MVNFSALQFFSAFWIWPYVPARTERDEASPPYSTIVNIKERKKEKNVDPFAGLFLFFLEVNVSKFVLICKERSKPDKCNKTNFFLETFAN